MIFSILRFNRPITFACLIGTTAYAQINIDDIVSLDRDALSKLSLTNRVETVSIYHSLGVASFEHSEPYKEAYQEILASGDETAPILIQLLKTAKTSTHAAAILNILSALETEDKEPIRNVYKRILSGEMTFPNDDLPNDPRRVLKHAASSLRNFGNASDAEHLLPLLDHEDVKVRVRAVQTLGLIGDSGTAGRIEDILKNRANGLSPDERITDSVFKFGEIALKQIKERYPEAIHKADQAVRNESLPKQIDTEASTDAQPNIQSQAITLSGNEEKSPASQSAKWPYAIGAGTAFLIGLFLYWRIKMKT